VSDANQKKAKNILLDVAGVLAQCKLPQFEHKSATEMPQNLRKYRVSLYFLFRYC
jgi:hypothetical protein